MPAIVLILRRKDGWRGWNLTAGLVHLLLGTCNLIFWPVFESAGVVPIGVIATLILCIPRAGSLFSLAVLR